jgi:hypothetical protein
MIVTPSRRALRFATRRGAGLALCVLGTACNRNHHQPRRATSTPPPATSVPGLLRPANSRPDAGTSFVEQQMAMRVLQFANNLTPVMPMLRGTLPEGASATHTFDMAAGHCYRIIAVGGVEVNDLDLTLYAPDGSEVDSDTQNDNYPVIGRSRPVCPPNGGRYRLDVVMYDGQGEYGVQIFGTP